MADVNLLVLAHIDIGILKSENRYVSEEQYVIQQVLK